MSSSHPTGGKPDSAPGYKRPIPGMGVGGGDVAILILCRPKSPLTSDPVEVQLPIVGLFFRPQGLQGQLELLAMQGMLDAKLLKQ